MEDLGENIMGNFFFYYGQIFIFFFCEIKSKQNNNILDVSINLFPNKP